MATETSTTVETSTARGVWSAGAFGGLVAGVVMGVLLQTQMTPVITNAIPTLYGMTGLGFGWVAHLIHGVVFGLGFAWLATTESLSAYTSTTGKAVGLGLAYGVVIWVVAAAIVMPIWLGAVGFPGTPPLPNVNPQSLVGHVVYGVVLGGAFAVLRSR